MMSLRSDHPRGGFALIEALVPVADRIWLFPAQSGDLSVQPNVGAIVTGRGTVLVDAGNSPAHAQRIQIALLDAGLPPISFLILTHAHWDHAFGAQVYNVPVVGHDLARDLLAEMASRPWSDQWIEDEVRRSPGAAASYAAMQRAVGSWDSFRVVPPTMTFSTNLVLHLDDPTLALEHVGGQHALESVVVKIPAAGVAFVGDCFYPPAGLSESAYDRAVVERLLADESIHTFIDGHSPEPITRDQLARQLAD